MTDSNPDPKKPRCDPEQLAMLIDCSLKCDVTEWNNWREANPDEEIYLEGAKLRSAHLKGVELRSAYLEGANLGRANLKDADLNEAHLESANLGRANLEDADLWSAHLEGANLRSAHLEGAELGSAHLEGAKLRSAHLKGAELGAAHLEGAELESAHLEGAKLGRAHLEGANLWRANLEGASLVSARLENANLAMTHLDGADLCGADLKGATLREAHLEGADLCNAHLEDASFVGVVVDGATLITGCTVDRETDFTTVALDAARVEPGLKQLLQYNIRRKRWSAWYSAGPWWLKALKWAFVCPFFWISDYGCSTLKIIFAFFALAGAFTLVYWQWPSCITMTNGGELQGIVHAFYFSVVTMTTLGFGDIHANPDAWYGQVLLMFQVLLGYVLLGALITRFAVLFTAGGPSAKFADERQRDGKEDSG